MAVNPYFSLIQKYFPQSEWQRAYNVMMGESSGRPNAVGDTNTPHSSYGLFQIRALPGRPSPQQLMDPEFNVRFAANMFNRQGWQPWTVARKLGYTGKQQTQQLAQQTDQQPVEDAIQKIMQILPKPVSTPAPMNTNIQSSAIWPVVQSRQRGSFASPLASANPILPTARKGQSIPEAFYGAKT